MTDIIRAGKFKTLAWPMYQLETEGWLAAVGPGRSNVPVWGLSGRILSSAGGIISCILLRLLTDLIRPTHIKKNNKLYSIYQFQCYFHSKQTQRNTENNVLPNILEFHNPIVDTKLILLVKIMWKFIFSWSAVI